MGEEEVALEVDKGDGDQVQEPSSLNSDPKKSESFSWNDIEEEARKESSASSDDEALANLIARMKEKNRIRQKPPLEG